MTESDWVIDNEEPMIISRACPTECVLEAAKSSMLLEACKGLLDAIELLGHTRAASDCAASDLEYSGDGILWRDYIEICLLDAYDLALAVYDMPAKLEQE